MGEEGLIQEKMGLPDESSIFCETCSSFNLQEGIILDGKVFCGSCLVEKFNVSMEFNRMKTRIKNKLEEKETSSS